jgi:hypothetical protein
MMTKIVSTIVAKMGMKERANRRGADHVTSPVSHHCIGSRLSIAKRLFARNANAQTAMMKMMAMPKIVTTPAPDELPIRDSCWLVTGATRDV